jgi:hypothetical protein
MIRTLWTFKIVISGKLLMLKKELRFATFAFFETAFSGRVLETPTTLVAKNEIASTMHSIASLSLLNPEFTFGALL